MRLVAVTFLIVFAFPAAAAPVPRNPLPDPLGRGYLGIYFSEVIALSIEKVEQGTAAERAGLMPGDVFVRVGPLEPRERIHMQQLLIGLRPGSRVLITVRRGGELKTVVVQLGSRPENLDTTPLIMPIPPP